MSVTTRIKKNPLRRVLLSFRFDQQIDVASARASGTSKRASTHGRRATRHLRGRVVASVCHVGVIFDGRRHGHFL